MLTLRSEEKYMSTYCKYDHEFEIMTRNQIEYITCVIGALSQMTCKSCSFIYNKLQAAGIIKDYLAAAYDVLHTFSLEYVAEDVINLMKKKGHALC